MFTPEELKILLPLGAAWMQEQEARIHREGELLNAEQLAAAKRIGIKQAENVHLLFVDEMPRPENPTLLAAVDVLRFLSPDVIGLTLGYGIFIRHAYRDDLRLLVHELTHTLQYERMGGIAPFIAQYVEECMTVGYADAPLEKEARATEKAFGF